MRVVLTVLMALLIAALSYAPQAWAQVVPDLRAAGPTAANGFPRWYQDADGTRLALCTDGTRFCAGTAASDLVAPDGEAFYWNASAFIDRAAGGKALLTLAAEDAFANQRADSQIGFGRVRVLVSGLRPDTAYKVTYPYGVLNLTSDARGQIKFTKDSGCGAASAARPCDFSRALGSHVFDSFLEWDPSVGRVAPVGYIGNPNVDHKVVGSPLGTNFFRVEGPDAGGLGSGIDVVQTDLFSVQGKLK